MSTTTIDRIEDAQLLEVYNLRGRRYFCTRDREEIAAALEAIEKVRRGRRAADGAAFAMPRRGQHEGGETCD